MKHITHNLALDSLPPGLFRLAGNVNPPPDQALNYSSIIILGFARSGKTILARRLHEELGFSVFPLDTIRHSAYSRPATRRAYVDLLLRLYPRGLVIEGDNLIGENRSSAKLSLTSEFQQSIRFLRQKSLIVCVGNSETTVEEKAQAILDYRKTHNCWTTKAHYGTSQIRNLAARSIGFSNQLRSMADELELDFFELRPQSFEQDLADSVIRIKDLVSI